MPQFDDASITAFLLRLSSLPLEHYFCGLVGDPCQNLTGILGTWISETGMFLTRFFIVHFDVPAMELVLLLGAFA
jgi:hypothetical protein